ncbi:hypothetical protein M4F23_000817 [Salmonella enterica]|nr:hypothetical protein [Salmonella enterica]
MPPLNKPVSFSKYSADIRNSGKENFIVCFALYTLDADGESQKLFGYYCWDPAITVL